MTEEDEEFNRIERESAMRQESVRAAVLAQPQQEPKIPFGDNYPGLQWDEIPQAFNDWWNADYDPTGNSFEKDTHAYWAWAGWKAAKQPAQQEPVTDEENEKFSRDVSGFKGADPEATKYALEEFLRNRVPAIGDIRALKHRIHALEGDVIGYKQLLDAAEQPAQRKPLTRQHINQMMADAGWQNSAIRQADLDKVEKVARAIEAAHGIKGDA